MAEELTQEVTEEVTQEVTQAEAQPEQTEDNTAFDGLVDADEDEAFTNMNVPGNAEEYFVSEDVKGHEETDDGILKAFKDFSHTTGIPQAAFAKVVQFSFTADKYDSRASMMAGFNKLCKASNITATAAKQIVAFADKYGEGQEKESGKISNRSGVTADNASKIVTLRNSKAYKTKGLNAKDRAAHKVAVKQMLELCSN